ncbi:hypothetical protein RRG08_043552 [Elysia crispata]|uniref:Uncharacterized protein n=1 Tax=Elysia crispata TaxID=231223 RepID=A0AAE1CXX3_9GAST|nr:hypothetical protein RRG08_043552 [Elysia crispata]
MATLSQFGVTHVTVPGHVSPQTGPGHTDTVQFSPLFGQSVVSACPTPSQTAAAIRSSLTGKEPRLWRSDVSTQTVLEIRTILSFDIVSILVVTATENLCVVTHKSDPLVK